MSILSRRIHVTVREFVEEHQIVVLLPLVRHFVESLVGALFLGLACQSSMP